MSEIFRAEYRKVLEEIRPALDGTHSIRLSRGHLVALISKEDLALVSDLSWSPSRMCGKIYARANIGNRTVLMHRLLLGVDGSDKSIWVDHVDGNGLNNIRTNLRLSDATRNRWNSITQSRSGFKGVSRSGNGWSAKFVTNGKNIYAGHWKTEVEAALAYNDAAVAARGEFARLNEVPVEVARKVLIDRLEELELERGRILKWIEKVGA